MRIRMVFGVVAIAAALAAPAFGAEGGISVPTGDRELGAKMLVCDSCHEAGRSKTPGIPIISGQQENYLTKQLHDFRTQERKFEIMTWMSETLAESETASVAARIAKKPWPARAANVAAAPAPRGIAVCQACHAQNYMGALQAEGMTTPRLAGQSYEYLVETMRKFAEGERTNNGDMVQIMKGIPAADRDAMAKYLSSL